MTESMIEKIAKALVVQQYGERVLEFWPDRLSFTVSGPPFHADEYRDMARAAIEAMREPTEAMVASASDNLDDEEHAIRCAWQAMIDATLSEKP